MKKQSLTFLFCIFSGMVLAQSDSLRQRLMTQFHGLPIFESFDSLKNYVDADSIYTYHLAIDSISGEISYLFIDVWNREDTMLHKGVIVFNDSTPVSTKKEAEIYVPGFYTAASDGYRSKKSYRILVRKLAPYCAVTSKKRGILRNFISGDYMGRYKETYFYLNETDVVPCIQVKWSVLHHWGGGRSASLTYFTTAEESKKQELK